MVQFHSRGFSSRRYMDTLNIISNYTPPWGLSNVLWELWDCGYQLEKDEDSAEYELSLCNGDLYINGELIPNEEVKEKLDYIFRRTD
jgi:hypothetical protein